MRKNFVLDTNVLLHDPRCFEKFEDNNIHILYPVLEELDSHKGDNGEIGYNAREIARKLNHLRMKHNLQKGVKTHGGGKLYFHLADEIKVEEMPEGWNRKKADNIILMLTIALSKQKRNVILVSNDAYMLLKANMLSVSAEYYKNDRASEDLYSGREIIHVSDEDFKTLSKTKKLKITPNTIYEKDLEIFHKMYLTVKTWTNQSILAQVHDQEIRVLENQKIFPMDIRPRNTGQRFLLESLLKPVTECPLICANGPAGTGKTLLALAAGLYQTMETKQYETVLLCRANVMLGGKQEELGALPGTEMEKISPLFRAIYDNCRIIFGSERINDKIDELFQRQYLDAQAIAYLRGRSIENTFIILDEAQNCTPSEILAITTRLGLSSRLCILGDTNQIDNPRLDSRNNGLAFAIDRMGPNFKDQDGKLLGTSNLCDIVTFTENECQRSPLAKEASYRMKL